MDLTKLEKIFEELLEHDKSDRKKFSPYETSFQKFSFWSMIIFFIAALLVAISTKVYLTELQKPIALLFVVFCQISALLYEISFILLGAKVLKEPTKHFLEPITKSSAKDYALAMSFCRFELSQLEYVKNRLNLEIKQMKMRVSLLVGAIEKVGIIPIAITWAFSVYKYSVKDQLEFSEIDYIVYGLLLLYILTISIMFFISKLERYTLLIDTAQSLKESEKN